MQITAICVDKTLISLNILNSNEHAYAAQRTRFSSRVCCAAWVCSFEFKILRLIRGLSAQVAAAVTTAYISFLKFNIRFMVRVRFLVIRGYDVMFNICTAVTIKLQAVLSFFHPPYVKQIKR